MNIIIFTDYVATIELPGKPPLVAFYGSLRCVN